MSTPVLQRFLRVHKLARPVRLRLALRLVVGAATLLAVLGFTRPVHAQTVPSIGGQWSQIYDWSGQITCPTTCTDASDLSAGAVLPVGLHRGKVVFWRQSCTGCGTTNRTTESWLFDPADPDDLIKIIHTPLDSDLFCAGFSWDREGRLLISGGAGQNASVSPAVWTYYFYPALLAQITFDIHTGARSVLGPDAWERIGDLGSPNDPYSVSGRYYPTVCPLNRRPLAGSPAFEGGGHLILGGSPDPRAPELPGPNCTAPATHPGWNHGTMNWQHIGPSQTTWDQRVLCPIGGPTPQPPTTPLPYDRRDITGNLVNSNLNTNPLPALETYPRAFQLSDFGFNQQQQVFIAFDMPTFSNLWLLNNPYGAAWIVKPAFGTQGWELQEAPTGTERFYGNALLFHCRPANGGLNRVVLLGGARNTSTAQQPELAPNWALVPTVQEFAIPSGQGAAAGQWVTKSTGPSRIMANSVILPTGQVLILGGGTIVGSCDAGAGNPAYAPELYDIGSSPTSPGTLVATMNSSNTLPAGPVPRLYHSMAALLEDGRVLLAAGENYPASQGFGPSGKTGEIFSPPYLFQGTRPTIASAPSEATFWATGMTTMGVTVNHSFPVDRMVLLRPATVTHAFDVDQRYIELAFTIQAGSSGTHRATVTLPSEDLGPPGWYMMYAVQVNAQGQRVPSIAWWIHFT